MKAITFIKQHGVEKAREVVESAPEGASAFNMVSGSIIYYQLCDNWWWFNSAKKEYEMDYSKSMRTSLSDLKRLVESVDLVGKVHGITTAKAHVKQAHEQGYLTISIPVEINGSIGMGCLYIDTLKQAIADYEQLFGNTETLGGEHV